MTQDFNTTEDKELQDQVHLDAALRNFRQSVHAWSDAEFARPRSVHASDSPLRRWLAAPAVTWATAAVLALAAVGVPVAIRHEHQVQVIARERLQQQRLRQAQEQAQELAQEKAALQLATTADDDKLLQHVDEDIRQSAPDALEPLASLMSASGEE